MSRGLSPGHGCSGECAGRRRERAVAPYSSGRGVLRARSDGDRAGMKRLIVGMTGASGAIYGVRLLEQLRELPVETHLIATRWARITIEHETQRSFADVRALADVTYS